MSTRSKRIRLSPEGQAMAAVELPDSNKFYTKYISSYKGRGVFSTESIDHGQFLLVYRGKWISAVEGEDRMQKNGPSFLFIVGKKECVNATFTECFARMVNDSVKPRLANTVMKLVTVDSRKYLCLFATRNLNIGDELLYYYGPTDDNMYWRHGKEPSVLYHAGSDSDGSKVFEENVVLEAVREPVVEMRYEERIHSRSASPENDVKPSTYLSYELQGFGPLFETMECRLPDSQENNSNNINLMDVRPYSSRHNLYKNSPPTTLENESDSQGEQIKHRASGKHGDSDVGLDISQLAGSESLGGSASPSSNRSFGSSGMVAGSEGSIDDEIEEGVEEMHVEAEGKAMETGSDSQESKVFEENVVLEAVREPVDELRCEERIRSRSASPENDVKPSAYLSCELQGFGPLFETMECRLPDSQENNSNNINLMDDRPHSSRHNLYENSPPTTLENESDSQGEQIKHRASGKHGDSDVGLDISQLAGSESLGGSASPSSNRSCGSSGMVAGSEGSIDDEIEEDVEEMHVEAEGKAMETGKDDWGVPLCEKLSATPLATSFCPACNMKYDSRKKRMVRDSCGHERCLTCVFIQDGCPFCISEAVMNSKEENIDMDSFDDADYVPDSEEDGDEDDDYGCRDEVIYPLIKYSGKETHGHNDVHVSVYITDNPAKDNGKESVDKITVLKRGNIKVGCKQTYDKVNYCTFCGKGISSKIARHLFTHSKDQHLMVDIALLPKRSSKRMAELEILVNEGNFKHNVQVLKSGEGNLVVARRDINEHRYSMYLPCVYCKKFLFQSSIWAHKKTCVVLQSRGLAGNDEDEESESSTKNLVGQGRSMLNSALFDDDEDLFGQLLDRMRNDEITGIVKKDPLIIRYATLRMESLGNKEDQKINDVHRVSQGTRSLARLVKEAQQIDEKQLLSLDNLIKPDNFDIVVKTTLKMSLHRENPATSVGKRMGHILSHITAMKIGLALRRSDKMMQNEAEDFKKLFESEWNYRVNSSCTKKQNKINRTKLKTLPLTEDLKVLREHIIKQMNENICALEERKLPENWTLLAKYTMCRLILFNMRRQAEVKDLTVDDYTKRPDWSQDLTGEFEMALSPADRILAKRMDMMIAAGKSRKNVDAYVLLPPDAKKAIENLLKHRSTSGVPKTNPYIFARRSADTPLIGTEELRNIANSCPGLVYPERISSNSLRKYIATVSQILDMTDKEVEMLAVHLGHDVKTHKENYRLAHSTRELTSVAQLLLTVESGNINKYRGKSLRDIDIEDLQLPEEDDMEDGEESVEAIEPSDDTPVTRHGNKRPRIVQWQASNSKDTDSGDSLTYKCDTDTSTDTEGEERHRTCRRPEKKRKRRWSKEENKIFKTFFTGCVTDGSMPTAPVIHRAAERLPNRTILQIRTRVHNIINGKQTMV